MERRSQADGSSPAADPESDAVSGPPPHGRLLITEPSEHIELLTRHQPEVPEKSVTLAGTLLLLLLAGLAMFDRPLAVLAIPGLPVYPAEIVLAIGVGYLLSRRRMFDVRTGRWFAPMLLGLFLTWGFLRLLGSLHYALLDVLRDSALVYYALFAVVVIGLSAHDSRFNPQDLVRLYGRFVPYFMMLAPLRLVGMSLFPTDGPLVPGTDLPFTSHRLGNLGANLGLAVVFLATSGRKDRATIAGIVSGLIMLLVIGTQNRGGMIAGFAAVLVALVIWNRYVKLHLVWVVVVLFSLGVLAWGFDLGLQTQNREISVSQFTTNIQSVLGSDTATQGQLGDTIDFRELLWKRVLARTVQTGRLENGWGFGPNLGSDFLPGHADGNLRNPHNSHITVIARLGLVGLGIWVALWLSWLFGVLRRARAAVRIRRPVHDNTGRLALLAGTGVVAVLVNAYVDPTLETPMVAVWLWSLFGFGVIAVAADRGRTTSP